MTSARVALATCRALPDIDPDDAPLVAPLADRGVTVVPAVWDDPAVDWSSYDLTVVRSTWDYSLRRAEFLAWAGGVPGLLNRADVLTWNTDKRYLARLAAAGAPVVPTTWLEPGSAVRLPADGRWVIKPTVSAGSRDAGCYDLGDPAQQRLAAELVDRLHAAGRSVMAQPYLAAVEEYGETALLFFAGRYSHAIRKGPMLDGPYQGLEGLEELYQREDISPRTPTDAELRVAHDVLAAVPDADRLLYARVDLIPGPDGPVLVELELAEPSVYLRYDPGAAGRFAEAVLAALEGHT